MHREHSLTKNWPSQILWRHTKPSGNRKREPPVEDCPDPGTMMRGRKERGANPGVQNEVGGCAGPGPRRLLPRRERPSVQAAMHYEYQARLLSLGEMPGSMRCHQGGYSQSCPQLISEHHHTFEAGE